MLFLVGNKCDMEMHREVDMETIKKFKLEHNLVYCCETSAKSGKNIERLFTDCARFIYAKYKGKFHTLAGEGANDQDNNKLDNSYVSDNARTLGSFKQSGGHRAGRSSRKRLRAKNHGKRRCKC